MQAPGPLSLTSDSGGIGQITLNGPTMNWTGLGTTTFFVDTLDITAGLLYTLLSGDITLDTDGAGLGGDISLDSDDQITIDLITDLVINGSPGNAGDCLKSQGAGAPPIWDVC